MPVSKKRKKDGKPVQRSTPVEPGVEHAHGPEAKAAAAAASRRAGKAANPFIAQQQPKRGAQRGR
jgi:hypothetical protein